MAIPAISGQSFVSVGFKTTLTVDASGGTWASSNEDVATVSTDGVVTGIALGTVTITYAATGGTGAMSFDVNPVRISNGFVLDRVLPAFRERLGWHQPATGPTLSSVNQKAVGGRYYDRGFHNAVTILNLWNAQENASITDAEFNQLLVDADDACTTQLLAQVFDKPSFVEHKPNFTRIANLMPYNVPNQDYVVGYRMNVGYGDYAVVLDSISLLFTAAAEFNIYLYNDLILSPVAQKTVETEANNQVRVQTDWLMNYLSSSDNGGNSKGNIGGLWFLCYKQREVAQSNPNCFAIDEQLNLWTQGKILGAFPFSSKEDNVYGFSRANPTTNFRSFGMNFEYSAYRDYTQLVIQNPGLFDEAKGLAMAIYVIGEITSSRRQNGDNAAMRENLKQWKVDSDLAFPTKDFPFVAGLKARYTREIKSLQARFNGKMKPGSIPIGPKGVDDPWAKYYQGFDINNLPPREGFATWP